MFQALKNKAEGKASAPAPKIVEKAPETPAALASELKPGEVPPELKPGEVDPKTGKVPETKAGDGKRPNPWKMVDEYKVKLAAAEKERDELRKGGVPEEARKAYEEKLTKAETRVQDLEKYLTFVDYSQTEEFKTQYVKPYEKAWSSAMAEIKDLTITDLGNGQERAVTANDMLQLVNAPLAKARQLATEMFGEFANDVMQHRQKIQGLFQAQQEALDTAKNSGQEKLKQARDEQQRQQSTLVQSIKQDWETENKSIQSHEKYGVYFQPREGDEKWNSGLEKGFALVDKAYAENPSDPKLTPEQRKEVIRRHAAVRNRAASWGPMRVEVERQASQIKALQEELSQYKELEPGAAGSRTPNANGAGSEGGTAKDRMLANLKKRAH